ncbi:isoprenylcysteine carboxylmethyltransferase family protein [Mycolicibacterium sp. P9-22]|uniref:methyltransferase family protein n=1 Tax=Mycolicibacterium sp. P9-22 TaxID=2024613 RepID=UPI0011EECF98|nr:isoprenylcysteine carboxylmethyltransferase family protein [Mycolicibacterium sp. P9-22]KAA0113670.1 isoprenylcysteine carboxylmethyltransferase family protein [Mycolicibacterium sp. P9-22]
MKLVFQTISSMLFGLVFFGVALFLPAWTFDYWQAWVFIAVFIAASIIPSFYLAVRSPAALQRRLKAGPAAETRPAQRIIISAIILSVVATLVLSAFDHRFGWSSVPVSVTVLGNVLVFLGLSLAQLVIVQNNYAAANVRVEADQPLVSTGLYGVVRHPMYTGTAIMMVGTPLALDSLWGLLCVVASAPVIVARIRDEEQMLTEELAGYAEYKTKVRHRLVPYLW